MNSSLSNARFYEDSLDVFFTFLIIDPDISKDKNQLLHEKMPDKIELKLLQLGMQYHTPCFFLQLKFAVRNGSGRTVSVPTSRCRQTFRSKGATPDLDILVSPFLRPFRVV
ncbi:hypothetical protein [Chitinophaga caseinilytica]|uniref:Uncharacterized protein n=1 Tax=Chitinophaga caseinilytica TaxID=2267521 RepID=A0ABZ2YY91_9BACT